MTSKSESQSPRPYGIEKDYFETVCRSTGGEACCRYVVGSPTGLECGKHTSLGRYLDGRVATGTIVARGDNCPGIGIDGAVTLDGL